MFKFLNKYITPLVKNVKKHLNVKSNKCDSKLDLIMETLLCRQKNCPLLISADNNETNKLVEIFAYNIAKQNLPFIFLDLEILKIDLRSILELNKKLFYYFWIKNYYILKNIFNISKIIVYIENINELYLIPRIFNLINYKKNILRVYEQPYELFHNAFKKNSFKCIATITPQQLENIIEFKKLSLRFQKLYIKNTNAIENYITIKNYLPILENYHNIQFDENAIINTIELTRKHINNTYYTNVVINILDRIGSIEELKNIKSNNFFYKFLINEIENIDTLIFDIFRHFKINSEYFLILLKKLYKKLLLKWVSTSQSEEINNVIFFKKFFFFTKFFIKINIDFINIIIEYNINFNKKKVIIFFFKFNNLVIKKLKKSILKKNINYVDITTYFINKIYNLIKINFNIYKYSIIKSIQKIFITNILSYFLYKNKKNILTRLSLSPKNRFSFKNLKIFINIFKVLDIVNIYRIALSLIYYTLENKIECEKKNNFFIYCNKKFKQYNLIHSYNNYIYNYYNIIKKIFFKKSPNDIVIDFYLKDLQKSPENIKKYIVNFSNNIHNIYIKLKNNLVFILSQKTNNKILKKKIKILPKEKSNNIDYNIDNSLKKIQITDKYIEEFFFNLIPPTKSYTLERRSYPYIEALIGAHLAGQKIAISEVSKSVRRALFNVGDPTKPIASYLFCGPTGVGKTEFCKSLSKVLYGGTQNLIRFDMSEFMEKHNISRLIGAPPGYIGSGKPGQLSELVKQNPNSIILFDEFEKAANDIQKIFLQILDEGRITDNSSGETIDFKKTIIILTSNIGGEYIRIEFEKEKAEQAEAKLASKKKEVKLKYDYSDESAPKNTPEFEKVALSNSEDENKDEDEDSIESIFNKCIINVHKHININPFLDFDKLFSKDIRTTPEEIGLKKKLKIFEKLIVHRLLDITFFLELSKKSDFLSYLNKDVIDFFLQEGDHDAYSMDFQNTENIMNIETKKNKYEPTQTYKDTKKEIMDKIKREYSPEFLNRLDDIILFEPISKESVAYIYDLLIDNFTKRLAINKMELLISEKVKSIVVDQGYNPELGARPLKRAIAENIQNTVVQGLMNTDIADDSIKILDITTGTNNDLIIKISEKNTELIIPEEFYNKEKIFYNEKKLKKNNCSNTILFAHYLIQNCIKKKYINKNYILEKYSEKNKHHMPK